MHPILLLADVNADYQTQRLAGAIARDAGDEFAITCASIGIGGDLPGISAAFLRLRSRDPGEVVHAWGGKAPATAALATRGRIIYSPVEYPTKRALRWLTAIMSYRDVQVI